MANTFASLLRSVMARAGVSVVELAAASGLSAPGLYHLLDGSRPVPSWRTVQALARALSCSTEEFRTD